MKHLFFALSALLASAAALTPITDSNKEAARDLWFENQSSCIAIYGHISDWDVSAVTSFGQFFYRKSEFNEDLSRWDVSSVTRMEQVSRRQGPRLLRVCSVAYPL